jgi:hypothetical protein
MQRSRSGKSSFWRRQLGAGAIAALLTLPGQAARADIRALACGANASYILKAEDHEIEASVPTHDLVTKCATCLT